jgi:hypothetical protein
LEDTPKFTQIGTFGLKIYHLATLVKTNAKKRESYLIAFDTMATSDTRTEPILNQKNRLDFFFLNLDKNKLGRRRERMSKF